MAYSVKVELVLCNEGASVIVDSLHNCCWRVQLYLLGVRVY